MTGISLQWVCAVLCCAARLCTGEPLDRHQIMAEIGIMWGAGFEVSMLQALKYQLARPTATVPFSVSSYCQ